MTPNSLPPEDTIPQIRDHPAWGVIGVIVTVVLTGMTPLLSRYSIWYPLIIAGVIVLVGLTCGYYYAVKRKGWYYIIVMCGMLIMLAAILVFQRSQSEDSLDPLILAISRFDTDTDDWEVTKGGKRPTYAHSGGFNSGGYISVTDEEGSYADWFYDAPSKFTGDKTEMYNGILRFALTLSSSKNEITSTDDIILVGNDDMTLTFDISNPGQGWTPYSILLNESAGWKKEDQTVPTSQEMLKVLSALKALRIRGEYRKGEETNGLDDVIIMKYPYH